MLVLISALPRTQSAHQPVHPAGLSAKEGKGHPGQVPHLWESVSWLQRREGPRDCLKSAFVLTLDYASSKEINMSRNFRPKSEMGFKSQRSLGHRSVLHPIIALEKPWERDFCKLLRNNNRSNVKTKSCSWLWIWVFHKKHRFCIHLWIAGRRQ